MDWQPKESYKPRQMRFDKERRIGNFRIKVYTVTLEGRDLEWAIYDQGLKAAEKALPSPPTTEKRPGVGFAICHQGKVMHYIVLCWWDNENELVTRVFVCKADGISEWREAESESFCVWDLEIMWFERNAYVETVMSTGEESVKEYLERQFSS